MRNPEGGRAIVARFAVTASRRRGAGWTRATLLAAAHVFVLAVAPTIHATNEAFASEAGVETEHSDTCVTLHADATCLACGNAQLFPTGAHTARAPHDLGRRILDATDTRAPTPPFPATHPARGPPCRPE